MTITLVTGANKGIGFETARQLATLGHHVIMAGRDAARIAAAAEALKTEGLTVEALVLDVTDAASIAAAHDHIAQTHGVLDVLVNNAGVMRDGTVKVDVAQVADWRATFDTNVFGMVALTTALIPLLRQSTAGRIVNVSSILGSARLNGDPNSPFWRLHHDVHGL
jgi:NADP-dependent 3-hydroxy acid dehydrogenase YdfG